MTIESYSVNVTRGGNPTWSPGTHLTALRGWYRADLGVTLVGADVDAQADQSSVGNHLTAPAAGNRPLFVASDPLLGNQPCFEYDGVAEYLRKAVFSMGAAFNTVTVAMVGYNITDVNLKSVWSYNNTTYSGWQRTDTKFGVLTPDGGSSASTTAAVTPALWVGAWDGANVLVYKGAAQEGTSADVTASVADSLGFGVGARSGGANFANVRVAEIIVMRAAINANERANLAAYSLARYGV